MTAEHLKAAALCWLRYTRKYPLIISERTLWSDWIPDALGVTHDRHLVEVEVKISVSDFRADAHKKRALLQAAGMWRGPVVARKYYLVAPQIAEAVRAELPVGCGLLMPRIWDMGALDYLTTLVNAERNPLATRLSVREVVGMVRLQSNTLCRYAKIVAEKTQTKNEKNENHRLQTCAP